MKNFMKVLSLPFKGIYVAYGLLNNIFTLLCVVILGLTAVLPLLLLGIAWFLLMLCIFVSCALLNTLKLVVKRVVLFLDPDYVDNTTSLVKKIVDEVK